MKIHKLNARGPQHLQKLKYTNCSKITQNADNDKQSQPMLCRSNCRYRNPSASSTVQLSTNTIKEYLYQRRPSQGGGVVPGEGQ